MFVLFFMHVRSRIYMDQKTNTGNDQEEIKKKAGQPGKQKEF